MDYSEAGVDIEASERAVKALADEISMDHGDYAGLIEMGDKLFGLTTDGVGTKILVAEALDDYSTIGIDCMAMNANDLIAMNVEPIAFVDYMVVDEPSERISEEIGQGLNEGAERANVSIVGGETAVMPEVVKGVDLAGTCLGIGEKDEVVDGEGVEPGDAVLGLPSSGIHSNGLTLARKAVTREHDYTDDFPYGDHSIGEELLEPTRIYVEALEIAEDYDVRGMAHITGGGFTNLERISSHRYVIDDPLPVHDVFNFVQELGDVSPDEMYRTFNMGMGFALVMPEEDAEEAAEEFEGQVVGQVEDGEGVEIPDDNVVLD